MTCDEARVHVLDLRRGRLPPELAEEVARHVGGCAACARASAEEEVLTGLLQRLPRRPAPPVLKRRLAALAAAAVRATSEAGPIPAAPRRRWVPALVAGVLAVAAVTLLGRTGPREVSPLVTLTSEAVSDHLRVLQRERPVDVESTGIHDVKPWFEGKLDFAPTVPAPVGPEMRLVGGTVGYFLDRPSAVVVYGVRRHVVTLHVFRADGLAWPPAGEGADRGASSHGALRGFHVFLWRSGGLGHALVGDVDPSQLSAIAEKLARQT